MPKYANSFNCISTGLDALSHAFEAIWNKNNNPIIDEIAKIAIKIIKFLPLVLVDEMNLIYRKEMQMASLFAGIAMAQTKTAICHSISYPLDIFIWLISWYSMFADLI